MYYDPLPLDSEPQQFVSERVLKAFDPLPLEKHRHIFKEGQRVTVIDGPHAGRSGRLKTINAHHGHVVQLDGGDHLVEYHHSELEPEGFSSRGSVSANYSRDKGPMNPELNRALKSSAVYDPLPLDGSVTLEKAGGAGAPAHTKAYDPLPLDVAEPVRTNQPTEGFADGLLKAIKDGTISAADRAEVETEISALRKTGSSRSRAALEALCGKYAGGGDRLEKRARPGLRVGMKVRDAFTGEVGIIESIEGALVKVLRADGEAHVLVNATMETLIPVDVAA